MPKEATEAVKNYWEERAQSDKEGATVTINDVYQRQLEIEVVLEQLSGDQVVLDVGCGNGYSTSRYSERVKEIHGFDYSESMIARAKQEYGHLSNVSFSAMDVMDLKLEPASFDLAVSQRCLINLTSWDDQTKALENIARVIRPGGLYIIQEGTQQGRRGLNQARAALGLSELPPVAYNLDFDEDLLWPEVERYFEIVSVDRFGLYDLIARIVHPLLVAPEEPKYTHKINAIAKQVAAEMQGVDEISRWFSAVLRRKPD